MKNKTSDILFRPKKRAASRTFIYDFTLINQQNRVRAQFDIYLSQIIVKEDKACFFVFSLSFLSI